MQPPDSQANPCSVSVSQRGRGVIGLKFDESDRLLNEIVE
jgi:hypothetical protein